MKPVVAFPFRHHSTMICPEAKQMLIDAGFELICNDTGRKLDRDEQKAMIKDAFAVISGTEKYDADMLDAAPNLKVILRFGVGLDNFDVAEMKKRGIQIGVISNNNAVAEFTLTLMLGMLKNLPRFDAAARNAKWDRYPMFELSKKTVGIIGFGRIGRRLTELLKGFGVKILVNDLYLTSEDAEKFGVESVSLEQLLFESDIVSLHAPSTPETRHMINAITLSKMKNSAILINTSRGPLVDEKALYHALKNGVIRGAALDVYETEPLVEGNPLFELENVVLAPHVAALTEETNYNAGITCAESVIRVYNGNAPIYAV